MKSMLITIFTLLITACSSDEKKADVSAVVNVETDSAYRKNMQSNQYINIQEIKGWTFEKIRQKYHPVHEEDFYLNKAPVSEFRTGLYNFFNEKERAMPILIKEATWKMDGDTNYTIWFKKELGKWQPVDSCQWYKEAEF